MQNLFFSDHCFWNILIRFGTDICKNTSTNAGNCKAPAARRYICVGK